MRLRTATSLRALCAGLLTILLPLEPAMAAPSAQLAGDARILHALNRFTFGPKPGEVEEVRRIGLDRWFEQQLHPAIIDDSTLDDELAQFPALKLSQPELLRRFPDPQMLRKISRENAPLPDDPRERAIYRNALYTYRLREQAKANKDVEKQNPAGDAAGDGNPPGGGSPAAVPRRGGAALGIATGYSLPPRRSENKAPLGAPAGQVDARGSAAQMDSSVALEANQRGNPPAKHREALYPESETAALLALSPGERMSRIFGMEPANLAQLWSSLSADERTRFTADLSPAQKETLAALGQPARVVAAEALQSRLLRDVNSRRQLEAVMTDFWLNHFNVYVRKNAVEPYLLPGFERAVRTHALGKFEDLLVATASSPAMLAYLDNAESIGPHSEAALSRRGTQPPNKAGKAAVRGLNENYARELMELHTIGVRCEVSRNHKPTDPTCGPGYTQNDVTEVAKVLTGWTVTRREEGSTATYLERRHEPGDKHILGHVIRQGGEQEGLELLHLLATSPATAQFICTKLAVRFVSDTPPPSLVARMTAAWRKSGGDLRTVLRAMYQAPEFWTAGTERSKVKTPLEFVASACRASGAAITNGVPLVQALERLGMPLYGMPTPNGYAWDAEPWVSSGALLSRMNFALTFADNRLNGTTVDWSRLVGFGIARPDSGNEMQAQAGGVDTSHLELALLGRPASPAVEKTLLTEADEADLPRQAEQDFLGRQAQLAGTVSRPSSEERRAAILGGLLLGSPDFQRR